MNKYFTSAISLVGLKQSAIYFDFVIPVNLGFELILDIGPNLLSLDNPLKDVEEYWPLGLQEKLLPARLKNDATFNARLVNVTETTLLWTIKQALKTYRISTGISFISAERFAKLEEEMENKLQSLISDYGLDTMPFDMASSTVSDVPSSEDIIMTVSQLELIDTSNVSWEHILEFRKSDESRERLRRFRLFAFENYSGKSQAYIEDDLYTRLADYKDAVKEWGFETSQGVLTTLLKSKLVPATLGGTVISTLVGQPLAAAATALAGTVLEVAGLTLQVQRRKFALAKIVKSNPVTFIDYTNKTLRKRPNKTNPADAEKTRR